jgi:hypothetical protein
MANLEPLIFLWNILTLNRLLSGLSELEGSESKLSTLASAIHSKPYVYSEHPAIDGQDLSGQVQSDSHPNMARSHWTPKSTRPNPLELALAPLRCPKTPHSPSKPKPYQHRLQSHSLRISSLIDSVIILFCFSFCCLIWLAFWGFSVEANGALGFHS